MLELSSNHSNKSLIWFWQVSLVKIVSLMSVKKIKFIITAGNATKINTRYSLAFNGLMNGLKYKDASSNTCQYFIFPLWLRKRILVSHSTGFFRDCSVAIICDFFIYTKQNLVKMHFKGNSSRNTWPMFVLRNIKPLPLMLTGQYPNNQSPEAKG